MRDIVLLLRRLLANTARSPYFILFSLVQPLGWLLLFGSLFSGLVHLPAFGGHSYISYLVPGIAIMTASFGSSFAGIGMLADLQRGLVEKLFASPVKLIAITLAPQIQTAFITGLQGGIIIAVGTLMHAWPASLAGGLGVMGVAFLVGLGLSGISNAVALLTREIPAVLGVMNFLALPLNFTSTMLMSRSAMPAWIRSATVYNPIDWAVSTARVFYEGAVLDRSFWLRAGALVGFAVFGSLLSALALRTYKSSL